MRNKVTSRPYTHMLGFLAQDNLFAATIDPIAIAMYVRILATTLIKKITGHQK